MPIWVRKNNGNWNNNPSANPSTNSGGYSLIGLINQSMVPFGINDNTSSEFNFGSSSFVFSVPAGFTAGWPNSSNTGFTSLDPTTIQGDASVNNPPTNTQTGASPAQGVAFGLAADAKNNGSYYFEMQLTGGDIFANNYGGGICIPGAQLAELVNGGYSIDNHNGGASAFCQSIELSEPVTMNISTIQFSSDLFTVSTNDYICFAVTFEKSSYSQVWLNF